MSRYVYIVRLPSACALQVNCVFNPSPCPNETIRLVTRTLHKCKRVLDVRVPALIGWDA